MCPRGKIHKISFQIKLEYKAIQVFDVKRKANVLPESLKSRHNNCHLSTLNSKLGVLITANNTYPSVLTF
jgi:hypothetical protein